MERNRLHADAGTMAVIRHLSGARDYVEHVSGWWRRGLAFGAGLVSVLAFAPFFLWPVLFFTLPILVWLIDGAVAGEPKSGNDRFRTAFWDGWWWGFGFFAGGLFWVGEAFLVEAEKFAWALPFAVTLLPAGLAVFFAMATAGSAAVWRQDMSRVFVLAVGLGLSEWARGHVLTGFPWNTLGYALTGSDAMMQSASLVGVYGLTLLTVPVFAAPLVFGADKLGGQAALAPFLRAGAGSLMVIGALYLFGAMRLAEPPPPSVDGVKIRIVQPSVPQREKWLPEKQREIFDLHLALSRTNEAGEDVGLDAVTHLIWPEAAMPFRPLEHSEALDTIGTLIGRNTYLYAGGLRIAKPSAVASGPEKPLRVYNSFFAFGSGGGLAALYDKIHLVPFGEFLPAQTWLEAIGLRQLTKLRGGFSRGIEPRPLIKTGRMPPAVVLICYEAIFGGAVVQGAERPGVIINVTNDGWFGNTTGPHQHFHQARVRAAEEGLPLLRAANNGISAVVDANGRTLKSLGMNMRGVLDIKLPGARAATFYARFGDLPFGLAVVVLTLVIAVHVRRNTIKG